MSRLQVSIDPNHVLRTEQIRHARCSGRRPTAPHVRSGTRCERARQRSRAGLDHEVIEGHTIGRGHPVLRSVSRRRLRAGQIHDVGLDSRRWLFEVYQAQWVCL